MYVNLPIKANLIYKEKMYISVLETNSFFASSMLDWSFINTHLGKFPAK